MMEERNSLSHQLLRTAVSVLLMVTLINPCANARPISREQASQRALSFMAERHDATPLKAVETAAKPGMHHTAAPLAADVEQYYVFNRGNHEGFLIMAGDDSVEPVLGYCLSGQFDYDQLPPALQEWLDVYAGQIARLQAGAPVVKPAPVHPAVPQLMDCTWNQGSPYNDECPMYFSLGRSVTGCVATAYAQILYFQRAKMVTETQAAMPAYSTYTEHPTYGYLHVDGIPKGSPIDWDNMLPSYGSGASAVQKKAVAQLMHYCGVGVKMDYTNSSSGAQSYEVYNSLRNYFGFGSSVRYVSYADVQSDDQWDELVYNELSQGRPLYISGANNDGGHAFVCDGYDGNRRFHINWGWGGSSDGFYYLTNLTPGQQGIGGSSDGYNAYREIIIGIEPENYAERPMTFADATARQLCTAAWDQDGDGKLSYGEAAAVTSLGTVLKGASIKQFTELHYFTSLTTIDDDAFNGCQQLTTVQLPRGLKAIGARAFKDCVRLQAPTLPDGLTQLGDDAFSGCVALKDITLPQRLRTIGARTFEGCSALQALTLPTGTSHIGDGAFANCQQLDAFTVKTMQPQSLVLGVGVFEGTNLAAATLYIMQGTRSHFAGDAQWQQFGTIKEERELSRGLFAPLAEGVQLYLHHVGTGRYLTKGEAWGTQAVVGTSSPMRFKLSHLASMPDGVYTITSDDTERDGHYLFRTNTDSRVGQGVQAAFVDGGSLTNAAHWAIADLGDNVYTISIPSGYDSHDANCRWGVMNDHASNVASPTWGVYSDVPYEGNELDCQWRFVAYDAEQTANYEAAKALAGLLATAIANRVNVTQEQAVYDNLESTTDELIAAQGSLRKKLNLVEFADAQVRQTCISLFDIDGDGELSKTEASQVASLGENRFYNSTITSFDELKLFTGLTAIYGNTFAGCRQLTSVTLPESIERIYYRAFMNCVKLTAITLPEYLNTLGDNAFTGCTRLKTVRVLSPDPAIISLGVNVFSGITLRNVTLEVPAGSKQLYEQADVWKNFGTIVEVRTRTQPAFSPIAEGVSGYIYNIGTRKMLSKGEAYGTQAVVSRQGMIYEFRHTNMTSEGQYILYSSQTGKDGKVLFRTESDTKVGEGVKACFVDGTQNNDAIWQTDSVAPGIFTLQVPMNNSRYVEGEYLGTQSYHRNDAFSPTDGIYFDVKQADYERQCQWAFITVADMQAAKQTDAYVDELKDLLERAAEKQVDAAAEQAVYDNLQSTMQEIADAIFTLREKLHYITFDDNRARTLCLEQWDLDGDGELTREEAALVTDIGEVFRNQPTMKSFDELRYFTQLKEIPENAFRNSLALSSIYLPEGVTTLGKFAFTGCTALKYVVLMHSQAMVPKETSSVPGAATLFVPESLVQTYQEDDAWKNNTVTSYTGTPVVTALPATRLYGRVSSTTKFQVTGAPINGTPELTCDVMSEATTPVGEYVITVAPGTVTSRGLICQDGIFTVAPAPLTITAKSYTRKEGEPNPDFELTYKGFRNRETADVLTVQPTVSCEATADSPAGTYDIVVSGAEAQNYEMTYVNGILTIEGANGIAEIVNGKSAEGSYYDLQGRRITSPARKGIYVDRQKRKAVLSVPIQH